MGFAAESAITIDGGHKCDSFVKVRYATDFLKLSLEDKYVREVDSFAKRHWRDKDVNQAKGVQISPLLMLAQFFDASGHSNFGPL